MLRRSVKRNHLKSNASNGKKLKSTRSRQPLGSVKKKGQSEHQLESLVLGGDDDIIEKLAEQDKVFDKGP